MIMIHDRGWTEVAFVPLPETVGRSIGAAAAEADRAAPHHLSNTGSFNSTAAALLADIAPAPPGSRLSQD